MKSMLFTTAMVLGALSQNAQSYWFDTPTYEGIVAQERTERIMELPQMRQEAEGAISKYLNNPAHKRYIETETRSHEVMGEAERAAHLTVPELLELQTENPIVTMSFPQEKMVTDKTVRETIKVNVARFGKFDVNNVFTEKELSRLKKELLDRSQEPSLLSEYKEDFNALFFDWRVN
jgi:septum formation topological specificity factor MinE